MSSPVETVSVLLREESESCPTGGGFTKTEWHIHVHDGWMALGQLLRRRRVGDVSIAVESADDPHGAASRGHWVDRPAQVYYRLEVRVMAPKGTRFRSRTWTPVRDAKRGVYFERADEEFELRKEDRLVPLRVLAERAAQKARPEEAPARLPPGEQKRLAGDLLSRLDAIPSPTEAKPGGAPQLPLFVKSRRRRPAELQSTVVAPAPGQRKRA